MQLNEAQKLIRKCKNKPKYRPNKWKHAIKAGCYPYALDLFQDEFFLVGDLIGKRCDCKVSDKQLIDTLLEELKEIGFDVVEIEFVDEKINENEFKIYLQRDLHTGYYHFLREDDNGIWSHKSPNELPTEKKLKELKEDISSNWCFKLKWKKGIGDIP